MITSSLGIAVSGLMAAGTRMQNAANNIANVHSTNSRIDGETVRQAYRATDVVQISQESSGGVRAELRERDPATVQRYAPNDTAANADGITEFPNVNLEEELIETHIAKYDYQANLKVIKTTEEMMDDLLDIKA